MPDRSISAAPLHTQLRAILVQRITNGEWKAGAVVPAEGELAREFNIAPGTVRKALQSLEDAQLIVRKQGRGTFVQNPGSADLASRYLRMRTPEGDVVSGEVRSAQVTKDVANQFEAKKLAIPVGAPVYRLSQVRFHNGKPLALEKRILPADLYPLLESASPVVRNSSEFAFSHGVFLGRGSESITAEIVDQDLAKILEVEVGTPILVMVRVVNTIEDRPAELRESWCRVDSSVYVATLGGSP